MNVEGALKKNSMILPVLSGLLLVAAFPPFNLGWIAWVAMVPLLVSISQKEKLEALKAGFICGVIYFGGVIPWVVTTLSIYGHISFPIAVFLALLLICYLALYISLFGWLIRFFGHSPEALLASAPVFVCLEYGRTYFISGFPWALLAHSQAENLSVIQIASIAGTAGVTFLIVLVNSTIAFSILKFRESGKLPIAVPLAALIAVLGNSAWGNSEIKAMEKANAKGQNFQVAVIQGNIDQDKKWDVAFREKVISTYFDLTRKEATKNLDLIVWPETAIPFVYGKDKDRTNRLLKLTEEISTPIIFGGIGVKENGEERPDFFNRAYAIDRYGLAGQYDKIHLVPFGEYVPFRKLLFFVDKITDAVGTDINEGTSVEPILVGTVPIGMQICYEIKYPELTREFVKNGAKLIVNITNDAWFGKSGASAQHMASLPFRAVENRVPLVRSANTGISGFVTAAGKMVARTDIFKTASVTHTVKIPQTTGTFYTKNGDLFAFLCAVFSIIGLWYSRKNRG